MGHHFPDIPESEASRSRLEAVRAVSETGRADAAVAALRAEENKVAGGMG